MKLIDKDKIVAEIERRLWLLVPKVTFCQQRTELENLLSFIDTLEVKEVDLKKENLPVSNSLTEEGLFTFEDGSQAIITKSS